MAELSTFKLHPGDAAPDFALPGTDGRTYRRSDFTDAKLLVVSFWCNHCPYVQAWEGRMIELARRYQPKGVSFVLINSNDDLKYPEDGMKKMIERARVQEYPMPYLRDESQDVARAYGALVTPHPFLFDADGRLLFQGRIDDRHDEPNRVAHRYLQAAIDNALAHRPVEPVELPVVGCSVKWKA